MLRVGHRYTANIFSFFPVYLFIFSVFFFKSFFLFVIAGSTSAQQLQQSVRAAARGLALCPWYHLAWVSVSTPVGPGKDTPGTLGPDQQEGRGWPMRSDITAHSAETRQTFTVFFFFESFFFSFFVSSFFLQFFPVFISFFFQCFLRFFLRIFLKKSFFSFFCFFQFSVS